MKKWIDGYCRILAMIMALLLAIMVMLVFGNVIMRYAFQSSIVISEELSRWLFVWLTFMGAVIALHEHGHMMFGGFLAKLSTPKQRMLLLVAFSLMLFISALILKGSISQFMINLSVTAPVSNLSMGWLYGVGVFFGVSSLWIIALDLYEVFQGRLTFAQITHTDEPDAPRGEA